MNLIMNTLTRFAVCTNIRVANTAAIAAEIPKIGFFHSFMMSTHVVFKDAFLSN